MRMGFLIQNSLCSPRFKKYPMGEFSGFIGRVIRFPIAGPLRSPIPAISRQLLGDKPSEMSGTKLKQRMLCRTTPLKFLDESQFVLPKIHGIK